MTQTGPPPEASLAFRAGGAALRLPATAIAEVIALPPLTRAPLAPPSLRGLANIRGTATPVLALDLLLGAETAGASSKVIVLSGAAPVGLAVDAVIGMCGPDPAAGGALALDAVLAQALGELPKGAGARPAAAPEPAAARAAASQAFLRFSLGAQGYALPLAAVREVLAVPGAPLALPGADPVLLGAVPLRGEPLAVVCLARLLGLEPKPSTGASRLLVVSIGSASAALAVDRVDAVLRVEAGGLRPVPPLLNRGSGEAKVEALLRTETGLVAVLDPDRLFDARTMALLDAAPAGGLADGPAAGAEEEGEALVRFRLAGGTYALPAAAVVEVIAAPERITPVPRAPDFLRGLIHHRGAVAPLLDQRRRFGLPPAEAPDPAAATDRPAPAGQVLIVQAGDVLAGLLVDRVEQIVRAPAAALGSAEGLLTGEATVFDRVMASDAAPPLLIVEPERLLVRAERDLVRRAIAGAVSAA